MSDEEWDAWPKCAIPACTLKCCRSLGSKYCWPHTPGQNHSRVMESLRAEQEQVKPAQNATARIEGVLVDKQEG